MRGVPPKLTLLISYCSYINSSYKELLERSNRIEFEGRKIRIMKKMKS